MSYLDTAPIIRGNFTLPKSASIPCDEAKAHCRYIDTVADYLTATGFFNPMQVTFLIGLSAGSIACNYVLGVPSEVAADRIIELHGSTDILKYLA
jgi:hypothetical protein